MRDHAFKKQTCVFNKVSSATDSGHPDQLRVHLLAPGHERRAVVLHLPGTDFMKLDFGRKKFLVIFLPLKFNQIFIQNQQTRLDL
jgi:hypothetical protein